LIVASVARRYARALLSLGLEEGHHEKFGEELEAVLQALEGSREAGAILRNPGYTLPQRHAAADALAAGVNLSPVVTSFVRLLVDRQRIAYLPAIARAYRAMVDQQVGRVRAIVTAAAPLAEREIEELRAAIAAMTGRTIVLDTRTDPSLIGGVVTQVGATMLDGSLRTQLERMREELKRGPIVA
jgi:F-type H+-transporting ATPase subunit delta